MSDQVKNVLLVHQDPVEAGILAYYLRRSGLETIEVTTNAEALEHVDPAGETAVLSELISEEIDGLGLARACEGVPTVFMLLVDEPLTAELEFEAIRLGVGAVFTKPAEPTTVAEFIRRQRPIPLGSGSVGLPDDGIGGDLADRHATALIRFCDRHRISALVEIGNEDEEYGGFLVKEGRVIDAWMPDDLRGRAALNSALMLQEGPFALYLLEHDAEELQRPDVIQATAIELVPEYVPEKEEEKASHPIDGIPEVIILDAPSPSPSEPERDIFAVAEPPEPTPLAPSAPVESPPAPSDGLPARSSTRRRRHQRETDHGMPAIKVESTGPARERRDTIETEPVFVDTTPDLPAVPASPEVVEIRPTASRIHSDDIPPLPIDVLARHSGTEPARSGRRPLVSTELPALPTSAPDEGEVLWVPPWPKRVMASSGLTALLVAALALVSFMSFWSDGSERGEQDSDLQAIAKLIGEGRSDAARRRFDELRPVVQDTASGRTLNAVIAFRRGDYEVAGRGFREIARQESAPPEVFWFLGHVLAQSGHHEAAKKAWTRFLKDAPKHPKAAGLRNTLKRIPAK